MIKIKAPGRVCLFGDHQDYLGLPIIACAINRHIGLEAHLNNSELLKIRFIDINQTRSITIPYNFNNYNPEDTFIAVLKVLERYGCKPNLGYDISITGNIPINAGLSSSSALILIWISFLVQAFGIKVECNQELLAKIAYEAEVLERNGPGGKMDQFSIALGNIIYLETDEKAAYKTFNEKLPGLIIGESGIPKDTLGLLADRRRLALQSIVFLKNLNHGFDVKNITENTIDHYLDQLPNTLKPYFNAAVRNHLITQKALSEFEEEPLDIPILGKLMNQHHSILKNDLKITVPKIDKMIDAALLGGSYGAKIVGSGGGGCIIALAPENKEQKIIKQLKLAGAVNAYKAEVSEGILL